jgi:ABC-2 type transport system permease protein
VSRGPSSLALTLRAFPTMLRVGFADAVAYRAEMIVWMLSTTMPLVNLALWHSAAAGGAIAGFGQPQLTAYFLASFIVRQLTGCWVVWEMNFEVRSGRLSQRLLRPVSPMAGYMAENLAALPMRLLLSLPMALVLVFVVGGRQFTHDPVVWLQVALALALAWLIVFFSMAILGTLAFFLESSSSLWFMWQGLFFALSGYLFPLGFLQAHAPRLYHALHWLPFYYQSGFPLELMLGRHDRVAALRYLGIEACWVGALGLLLAVVWRAGVKRWNAYGA